MKKLREWVDKRGCTQVWFINQIGMSAGVMSEIMRGKKSVPKKYWRAVVSLTEGYITIEDLLNDSFKRKNHH